MLSHLSQAVATSLLLLTSLLWISTTGNAVFGGNITGGGDFNATTGTTFQLGSTASAKLGIGRAAATYNLEVEGSIYSTASTIIAGNGTAGKFIIKRVLLLLACTLPIMSELTKWSS